MKKTIAKVLATGMVLSMTAAAGVAVNAEEESYDIGICQLVQHPALDAATEGFKTALTDALGDRVTFDEQNASGDSATCSTIVNTFVTNGVDLMLANATASLQAAVSATGDIPILGTSVSVYSVALGVPDDQWTGSTGMNVSGTSDLAPLDEQAAMFAELLPEVKKVGIVYCSAEPNSVYQADTVKAALEEAGVECTVYTFADSNDIASVVTKASEECEALYIPTDNTAASNTEVINNICEPAGIPIITGEEGICDGCGIATLSIDYFDLGYKTGEMAVEILEEGADPAAMEIAYAPEFVKKYDAERCEAFGIEVPEDYIAIGAEEETEAASEDETEEAETEAAGETETAETEEA